MHPEEITDPHLQSSLIKYNSIIRPTTTTATLSKFLEDLLAIFLCRQRGIEYRPNSTTFASIISSLKEHERDCFIHLVCHLALLRSKGHTLTPIELANNMSCKGYSCLVDLDLFGLVKVYSDFKPFDFIHKRVQLYLAAIRLLHQPVMEIVHFLKHYVLYNEDEEAKENCHLVTQLLFGLAKSVLGDGASALLQNLLRFLSIYIDTEAPIEDNHVAILILQCLYEAQNNSLCLMAHHESFKSHIFVLKEELFQNSKDAFLYFLHTTLDKSQPWILYSRHQERYEKIMESTSFSVVGDKRLTSCFPESIVFSTQNIDYLVSVLVPLTSSIHTSSREETSAAIATDSVVMVSADRKLSSLVSGDVMSSNVSLAPYGFQTVEQFETMASTEVPFFFNFAKDMMIPKLQLWCPSLIKSQYRKKDHIWFAFTVNMRHHYYESVLISPIPALHWVKVPGPDGDPSLEETYNQKALQYQTNPPSELESAEVVLLNSQCLRKIWISPPSGDEAVQITMYPDSEDSDLGEIGCDYMHHMVTGIQWRKSDLFSVGKDELVGRELPLPSKRGTQSAEITKSTVMANIRDPDLEMTSSLYSLDATGQSTVDHHPLLYKPVEDPLDQTTIEREVKRNATEGFDEPGFCLYSDGGIFQPRYKYTLPSDLPKTRTLHKGPNGVILEVFHEGEVFAVKQTILALREMLILPKLRHKNIIKLIALMMGGAAEGHPRRRVIFQYFPRMTNDLGRFVGSYERFCLKTLHHKYKKENLLISRVYENFKFVAREILQALDYLHSLPSPVIHRDVKPSNILVKADCSCPNPLVCVCRVKPIIALANFDSCIELAAGGTLLPDPLMQGQYAEAECVYRILPVGTIGFKSPEGFLHIVGNSLESMPAFSTKADIYSFGMLLLLLHMNEDGPRRLSQVGVLLLYQNQSDEEVLTKDQERILNNHDILNPRPKKIRVVEKDIHKLIPIPRIRREFGELPLLVKFMERCLEINSVRRPSAKDLLGDPYLNRHHLD